MYVFIDGERKIFFKFIISTWEGLNSSFFSETQKKTLSDDIPENTSIVFLYNKQPGYQD